ncbi:hypothetical protein [Yoonia vestfoldensis]|uniref:hypothetical protein n=1 Tax=Yoonia vestfoldensis TaxID=245188 RepID=UPI0003781902|nr:hypothetical protein [Yoonia vestfoldensis]
MKTLVILTLCLIALGATAIAVGAFLPATRDGTAMRSFDAAPDLVRSVIRDIDSQPAWRAKVAAIAPGPDGRWTEVTTDGERITFQIVEDSATTIALSFESTRGYIGRWAADLTAAGTDRTLLTVTEQATTPSPIGRILSRLFFDPVAFAATYLDELGAEVARRSSDRGDR